VSGAIRIRLWGLRSACQTAARRIATVLAVGSVSEPRADPGPLLAGPRRHRGTPARRHRQPRARGRGLPDKYGEPDDAETGKGAAESRAGRGSSDAAAK
jgi:hypothetical protein